MLLIKTKVDVKTKKSSEYCLPTIPSIPCHTRLLKSQIKIRLLKRCTEGLNVFKTSKMDLFMKRVNGSVNDLKPSVLQLKTKLLHTSVNFFH